MGFAMGFRLSIAAEDPSDLATGIDPSPPDQAVEVFLMSLLGVLQGFASLVPDFLWSLR